MKKVEDIFNRRGTENHAVELETAVLDALKLMAEKNIGSVVVYANGDFAGLFTERDYARKVILHGKRSNELTVGEVMSSYLPKVAPSNSMEECMEIMSNHNIRYLPVFDSDRFISVISIIDVVKESMLEQKNTIEDLKNYIHFAG